MHPILTTINQALQRGTAATKKALSQMANSGGLDAVCAACVLVINANGHASQAEIDTAAKNIRMIQGFDVFSPEDVLKALDAKMQVFKQTSTAAIARERLVQDARKVSADAGAIVVQIAIAIGSADGNFDADERAAVARLIKEFGLNVADFPEMASGSGAPPAAPPSAPPTGASAATGKPKNGAWR